MAGKSDSCLGIALPHRVECTKNSLFDLLGERGLCLLVAHAVVFRGGGNSVHVDSVRKNAAGAAVALRISWADG